MVAGKYDIKLARRKFDLSRGMMEAALANDFAKVIQLADEYIALDRYALEPWGAKTAMYLVHLNQPDKALATARKAVEVNMVPLWEYEYEKRQIRFTHPVDNPLPVQSYLSMIGKYNYHSIII